MAEAEFLKNERPNEYEARFRVEGEVSITINAGSLDEAKDKARSMIGVEEFSLEPEDVTDVTVDYVWKSPTMFLVTRDGKTMQVSRLLQGDQPRQPTDSGF